MDDVSPIGVDLAKRVFHFHVWNNRWSLRDNTASASTASGFGSTAGGRFATVRKCI